MAALCNFGVYGFGFLAGAGANRGGNARPTSPTWIRGTLRGCLSAEGARLQRGPRGAEDTLRPPRAPLSGAARMRAIAGCKVTMWR